MRAPLNPPEFHDWTFDDGYVARGRVWSAIGDRRHCPILYLHGIQSHGGWYEWSASHLAANGVAVVLPDRRGSGLNQTARGDVENAERWLRDLDELATWMHNRWGDRRLDVVGVSWGGMLAAVWAQRRPERVRRLLLIAPGIFPAVDIGWWARVGVGASLLIQPKRRFELPLNDSALFTDNPHGREFIERDRLKLTHVAARLLYQSARLRKIVANAKSGSHSEAISVLLAQRDKIVRNGPIREWAQRVSNGRAEISLLPTSHTPEFEIDLSDFEKALVKWRDTALETE